MNFNRAAKPITRERLANVNQWLCEYEFTNHISPQLVRNFKAANLGAREGVVARAQGFKKCRWAWFESQTLSFLWEDP